MADRVGQQFGNYKLLRKLGTGGFADVYLGEHIHLGSEAAIKVMRDQLSDADKELFRTEGRNLVRLIHPNIVRLLEFGFENNIPYLVMDYAPNGSLREKYPSGTRLPLTTIVAYVKQAAEALQYAHDRKLIHRDVKPENMLLGYSNEILLSDFGIAVVSHSTKSMRTEDSIGTVAYMAPEQLNKKPRTASDQYALAIVVYSWLTGIRPFTGSFAEVVVQHLTAPIPPLRTLLPNLPVEVEQVILKALDKDPQQRYDSIRGFAQALEQAATSFSFNRHNVSIAAGSRSDPGIKRKEKPNEDSLLAVMGERTCNRLPQQFGLFVVADGMGGHANGQDASRLAIQTMVDCILPKLSSNEELDDQAFVQLLVDGVRQANLAVYERNMEHHADMGTTMTSAIVVGGMAYVANVGNSRTYMYREPEGLHKITRDHSTAAALVEAGIIRNEDIYTDPKRKQLYRSLGETPDLKVDWFIEPLRPDDKLLLCSDGLWEMVRDRDAQREQDIQRILSVPNADPKQTVNALINAANNGGGEDNISAIVVSVTEATTRTGMTSIHLFDKPESVKLP